jgi:hypothetical protein
LLAFGDLHCDRRHLRGLVERAVEERCDALVSLGDPCYLPRDPEGRRFLRSAGALLRRAGLELLLVEGNHDDAGALARAHGSFRDGDSSAVVLDSAELGRLVRVLCERRILV